MLIYIHFSFDLLGLDNVDFENYEPGPLLRIFQWRGQLRKGTSGKKGKVKKCTVWGGLGVFGIIDLPRLDFLQFQHDFRSLSDKKRLLLGGDKGAGGGGGSSSIYVKRGPAINT